MKLPYGEPTVKLAKKQKGNPPSAVKDNSRAHHQ